MIKLTAEDRRLLEETTAHGVLSSRTVEAYRSRWNTFVDWLAAFHPEVSDPYGVSPEGVAVFLARAGKGYILPDGSTVGPLGYNSLVGCMAALSHYNKSAGGDGYGMRHEPIRHVMANARRTKPRSKQAPAITKAEFDRLARCLEDAADAAPTDKARIGYLRDLCYVRIGFVALLRDSELRALRWRDVKPDPDRPGAGTVYIAKSKTDQLGRGVKLHITSAELRAVDKLREAQTRFRTRPEDLIIGRHPSTVSRRLKRAANLAGIKDLTSHSFRVSGATYLASQGISSLDLMAIGRWRKIQIAEQYCRAAEPDRRAAALRYHA